MSHTSEVRQTEASPSAAYLANESKQIAKGGAIVIVGTLAAQALGMVTTLWIARMLGPEQFGLLSLATSVLFPLAALANLGLGGALVRFLPVHIGQKDHAKVAGAIGSTFIMVGIASLVVMLATMALAAPIANIVFSEPQLASVLRTLAFSIPLIVLTGIALASTRGTKLMHYDAIEQVAGPVFLLISWGIGLLLFTNLLAIAIYATLIRWFISAILSLGFVYVVYKKYFGSGIDWAFKSLLIYSGPLIISSLMYTLAPRMDRIVLGVVDDSYAVGVYSLAASVVVLLKLVHASIVKTFMPVVADAHNRVSTERAQMLYVAVTRWDSRLTFIGVAFAILLAQELLGILGERYSEALLPFVILAVSVFIGTLPGPTGAYLQMTNRQRVEAINATVFFILAPAVQIALALWLGWIGVAIGVLVMAVVINLVQIAEIYHLYGFHPFQRDHLLFTGLAIGIVAICGVVGVNLALVQRLLVLTAVFAGFLIFVYLFRTSSDEFLLNTVLRSTPFSRISKKS